jgi:hypothetical protein
LDRRIHELRARLGNTANATRHPPPLRSGWFLLKIVANGGKIVQPIGAYAPEITARFRDPPGNVIGLYQQPA